ncbi:MAG: rhodanese-like domain-containing protein [Verrucomicrobiales bacterium]
MHQPATPFQTSPTELIDALSRVVKPDLIDVRDIDECRFEAISGSRLLPLSLLEKEAPLLDKDREMILVCQSGRRSEEGQEKLALLGFNKVGYLGGGINAWKSEGHLVEKARMVWPLERQVRFTAGLLVVIGAMLSFFANAHFIWFSAFIGAGLMFAAFTNTCGMGVLLAKMPWNRCPSIVSPASMRTQ